MGSGVMVGGFGALGLSFVGGLLSQLYSWAPIMAIIAELSLFIGTVLALVLCDLKRLLAYSGVAHAGYILTGMVAGIDGIPAMWFYVATYAFMVIGSFAVVSVVSGPESSAAPIGEYSGLVRRNGELGWLMTILILGMSGMPFFAGFVGKLFAFIAAANVGTGWPVATNGYLWLVVIGALTTVIGFAFYLRVVSAFFSSEGADDPIEAGFGARFAIVIAATITLVFGIVPWPLLDVVRDALPL